MTFVVIYTQSAVFSRQSFILLFVCLLQGKVGDRRFVQRWIAILFRDVGQGWVQIHGCGWGMGSRMGLRACLGMHVDTGLGQGLGWTSFSHKV